ncbi:MAG: hypothetical protein MJ252_01575 [archaeon]|nr:hypothetical protein [archaeon]
MACKKVKEQGLDSIILINDKTKDLVSKFIRCEYRLTSTVKGFNVPFDFFEPIDEGNIIYPTPKDPFPYLRTHYDKIIAIEPKDENDINNKRTAVDLNEDGKFMKNFKMIGYEKNNKSSKRHFLLKFAIHRMQKACDLNKNIFLLIKGNYGCGKSLFIRKILYEFLLKNPNFNEYYYEDTFTDGKPNFILCQFQYPLLHTVAYNGVAFIFKQIYLSIKNLYRNDYQKTINTKDYDFDIKGNIMGRLLVKSKCLELIPCLNEILSCSREDINLYENFNGEAVESMKKLFEDSPLFEKNKKRDPFFVRYILDIESQKKINKFFIYLLEEYKKGFSKYYKNKSTPFILVIEDVNNIDSYSVGFLQTLMNENNEGNIPNLSPFIVLMSFTVSLYRIKYFKPDQDNFNIASKFTERFKDFSLLNSEEDLFKPAEFYIQNFDLDNIESYIKYYYQKNGHEVNTVFRVEPLIIKLLFTKSFNGIPLFVRELFDHFIKHGYIQNCINEILVTNELFEMVDTCSWNDFPLPQRLEKVTGAIIDTLCEKDIIILKHAAFIGTFFDIDTLLNIIPFNNITLDDLYVNLNELCKEGIIQILYDSQKKHKIVVYQFSHPYLRETLYQRSLIEHRSEAHAKIATLLQKERLGYLPRNGESVSYEKHQWYASQTVTKIMQDVKPNGLNFENLFENDDPQNVNVNALKTSIVKDICKKIRNCRIAEQQQQEIQELKKTEDEVDDKKLERLSKVIKYGELDKKSDGKITWETRFFVMDTKKMSYYYTKAEFLSGNVVPLAIFDLKDTFNIIQLKDNYFYGVKNIFSLKVTKWIKKGEPKGLREYFLAAKDVKELYSWLISMNFIRVNAYFESYTRMYGQLRLPIFKQANTHKKKIKRKIQYEGKPVLNTFTTTQVQRKFSMSKKGNMRRSSCFNLISKSGADIDEKVTFTINLSDLFETTFIITMYNVQKRFLYLLDNTIFEETKFPVLKNKNKEIIFYLFEELIEFLSDRKFFKEGFLKEEDYEELTEESSSIGTLEKRLLEKEKENTKEEPRKKSIVDSEAGDSKKKKHKKEKEKNDFSIPRKSKASGSYPKEDEKNQTEENKYKTMEIPMTENKNKSRNDHQNTKRKYYTEKLNPKEKYEISENINKENRLFENSVVSVLKGFDIDNFTINDII